VDIQVFGDCGLVSTELFTVLTMTSELSMYQLSGIEVKRTVKDIFLLTLLLGYEKLLQRRNQSFFSNRSLGTVP
jgi:hypothetical protein